MKNKKGSTLVELCVTMALVAIICSMTLTFVMLMRQRTALNEKRDDMLQGISNAEQLIKKWLVHYDNYDYVLSVKDINKNTVSYLPLDGETVSNGNGHYLCVTYNSPKAAERKEYYLSFENGTLKGDWYDASDPNATVTEVSDCITQMTFDVLESQDSGKHLVKCLMFYTDPQTHQNKSFEIMYTTHAQSHIVRKITH